MSIFQLAYYSRNTIAGSFGDMIREMQAILATARSNNARLGITGSLVFDRSWFVQVLEGPKDPVWALYMQIEKDPRHRDVALIGQRTGTKRSFGAWAMAAAVRNEANEEIYLSHGLGSVLDPRKLDIEKTVSLLTALNQRGTFDEAA